MHETGSDSEKNCNTGFIHVAEPEPPPPFGSPCSNYTCILIYIYIFFSNSFCPRVKEGPLSVLGFMFRLFVQYWQDAGIGAPVAATPARYATHIPLIKIGQLPVLNFQQHFYLLIFIYSPLKILHKKKQF